jgi:hypothetical protein
VKLTLKDISWILLGSSFWVFCVLFVIYGTKSLPSVDSYFHVQISEIMSQKGLVLKDFPWAVCSIWADSFFDKEWLFHVWLIPFISLFGKFAGAKIAVLATVFAVATAWGILLRQSGIRRHIFPAMCFMLFIAGCLFFERLTFCRSYLFALIFLPMSLFFVLRGNRIGLMTVSYLYAISHTGSWQLLPVVLVFDIARRWKEKESFKITDFMSVWVLFGLIAGLILNPYFPANIKGIFIQNVMVLKIRLFGFGNDVIEQGFELYPMTLKRVMQGFIPVAFLTCYTIYDAVRKKKIFSMDWMTLSLLVLTAVYFMLTILCQRFIEYFAPISAVFILSYWGRGENPLNSRLKKACFVLLFVGIAMITVLKLREVLYFDQPKYAGAAEWIKRNTEPGEIVFTVDWDDSPMLFYGAPQQRYLVFLEPYFMYLHSPQKYRIWKKISDGKMLYAPEEIFSTFHSKVIFVSARRPRLIDKLDHDNHVKLRYAGPELERIYTIDPEGMNIQYPTPLR